MKKGIVPCPAGIDTDARWGYSHTKGWIFGYKLHLTCTTAIGESCMTIDSRHYTTANVPDNKMYVPLTSSSSVFSLPSVLYTIADPGYDAKRLYEHSKNTLEIDLICPVVERYESTFKKRLELVCFYESEIGQSI